MMMKKRVGFVTCVQLGLSCIEEIYRLGGTLEVLITLEDNRAQKKSGRIYLDNFAEKHNISLIKIKNINEEIVYDIIKDKELDWLFIIGWSQIAQKKILDAPQEGCIGMHPTLLPKGRGRASIPWAILKNLPETGVTMFRLNEGVDTGDIIGQEIITLNNKSTASELYEDVKKTHIKLISSYWNCIVNGTVKLRKQEESEATEWPERRPEDGEIKQNMSVDEALTLIRAVTHPYPGAFIYIDNKKYLIWSAEKSDIKNRFYVGRRIYSSNRIFDRRMK